MTAKTALRVSALIALLGVALGAFGAHGLKEHLAANGRAEVWEKAVLYHLVHAVALVGLSLAPGALRRGAWVCLALGIAVFSGSLYLMGLTDIGVLGAVTPVGGVLFLVGWGTVVWKG